jgi:hypothetical protein
MKAFFFFLLGFTVLEGICQFDLKDVPDSLTERADELIIYDSTFFHVRSINESYLVRKYKIVVLQDPLNKGKGIYLYQDKFKDVDFVNVKVTNSDGSIRDNIKLKDFNDVSIKGYSMASDSRILYYRIIEKDLPYALEVSYRTEYSGSMFYPKWQPQDEKVGVISSVFTVQSEVENSFRHKSHNVDPTFSENGKHASWSVANLPPYKYEFYSSEPYYYGPVVYTAPNQFQMDMIAGNMESWSSFGEWINKLNFGKDDLDTAIFSELKTIIPESASKRDKVRIIYHFLQNRTRYVSVQLGIGGWQPFNSNFVHENGFGDCKALSFYAQSLLTRVGVESFYTLIRAGQDESDTGEDFPMSQFNHAILTVPIESDTIWLECTSQTNPFGYLGTFTSDRNALMIKPGSSKIIRTKKYSISENLKSSKYLINVNAEGASHVQFESYYSGIMIEEDQFDNYSRTDQNKQINWFIDKNNWSSMHVESLTLTGPTDEVVPEGQLVASFKLDNMVKKAGKRLFISLQKFLNSEDLIVDKQTKNFPFEINYNKSYVDSLVFFKPTGYQVESQLKANEYISEFGIVSFFFEQRENEIMLVRNLAIKEGRYEADQYEEFQKFISKVKKMESRQLVLINKT